MLHRFFEPGDWFSPKRFGYGAGLPIAWQGWVLLLSYLLLVIGSVRMIRSGGFGQMAAAFAIIALATCAFLAIARKRTRGGWHWRWGEGDDTRD